MFITSGGALLIVHLTIIINNNLCISHDIANRNRTIVYYIFYIQNILKTNYAQSTHIIKL